METKFRTALDRISKNLATMLFERPDKREQRLRDANIVYNPKNEEFRATSSTYTVSDDERVLGIQVSEHMREFELRAEVVRVMNLLQAP